MSISFSIVMSVVIIVMTAIDLAKQTNSLMIASDVFFIVSATIQILAIAAGWISVALVYLIAGGTIAATGGKFSWLCFFDPLAYCYTGAFMALGVFTLVSTWGGPLAIVFALIGLLIFLIWFGLQGKIQYRYSKPFAHLTMDQTVATQSKYLLTTRSSLLDCIWII